MQEWKRDTSLIFGSLCPRNWRETTVSQALDPHRGQRGLPGGGDIWSPLTALKGQDPGRGEGLHFRSVKAHRQRGRGIKSDRTTSSSICDWSSVAWGGAEKLEESQPIKGSGTMLYDLEFIFVYGIWRETHGIPRSREHCQSLRPHRQSSVAWPAKGDTADRERTRSWKQSRAVTVQTLPHGSKSFISVNVKPTPFWNFRSPSVRFSEVGLGIFRKQEPCLSYHCNWHIVGVSFQLTLFPSCRTSPHCTEGPSVAVCVFSNLDPPATIRDLPDPWPTLGSRHFFSHEFLYLNGEFLEAEFTNDRSQGPRTSTPMHSHAFWGHWIWPFYDHISILPVKSLFWINKVKLFSADSKPKKPLMWFILFLIFYHS